MKLNPQDLAKIADVTLAHYNQRAEDFWRGTRDHDVSHNVAALLQYIQGDPPFKILDFGCGPGRDLKAFAALGHTAAGLEGAAKYGSRIFSSLICRTAISMASSPMPRCFMCRARSCRGYCGSCAPA
jgi:hypothetical protein